MLMRRFSRQSGAHGSGVDEIAELRRNLLTAEAIIKAEPQVLVFWDQGQGVRVMTHTLAGIGGLPEDEAELLKFGRWLDVASAQELKKGLDGLFAEGRPFTLLLKTVAGGHVEADGRATGGRAILRLREVAGRKRDLAKILEQHRLLVRDTLAGRTLLNALPLPVWFRHSDGRIEWVNEAYVKAVEARDDKEVRERQIELLEARQREAVQAALAKGAPYRERVHLISGGARKAHDVVVLPLEGATVGAAIDVAALETAQGELVRHVAAYERTLDRVATGVAIFGPDQRLTFFNEAYRKLWLLDPHWLATKPSDSEVLDRLRELSRLPEVGNYRDWKAKLLAGYKTGTEYEDWWHLLDGRTIHVVSAQRPDGGLTYLYDDATERFALESRYNAMIDAQRETLDSLKEGVAGVRDRRAPQDLQLGLRADLAPVAQHAGRGSAHRRDHRRLQRALRRPADLGAHQPGGDRHLGSPPAGGGADDAARPERDRLRRVAAAGRGDADHLRRRHRHQALRADPAGAQRRAGGGRPAEEPLHQPRVL